MSKNDTAVISGWVARDKGYPTNPYITLQKPERGTSCWHKCGAMFGLPDSLFPEITWESEPQEVEITIKKIEK